MNITEKINSGTIKRWLPLAVIILLAAGIYFTGLHNSISLELLKNYKSALADYTATNPARAGAIFMVVYIIAVALSLPIATVLTLLGGFLFGVVAGTIIVVTAATAGATIIFLVARTSIGTTLREKAGTVYEKIEANMQDNAAGYLLFMRLVPLFPFFIVNIIPALFNVSLPVFIITTFCGIIPGSFVYVNLGERMAEIETLDDLMSGKTAIALALLGLFALLPALYKQIKRKNHD